MKKILKVLLVIIVIAGITSTGFSLYAHFLVDYSLENLELAVSSVEKSDEGSFANGVRMALVQDLAVEEAGGEGADFKNIAFLDMASQSIDSSLEAGSARASLYLKQVAQSKKPKRRAGALGFLDALYRFFSKASGLAASITQYARRRFAREQAQRTSESYSGLFLLKKARDEEGRGKLDKAADLYRRFLKVDPKAKERGYVLIAIGQILLKQRRYEEARRHFASVESSFSGSEEAKIAAAFQKKVALAKDREAAIGELKKRAAKTKKPAEKEKLSLKLAALYLSIYDVENARRVLEPLAESALPAVRQKAKFYLGWALKLGGRRDKSLKVFEDLLREQGLALDLELGLRAELADIYHQKRDIQKALDQYEKLATKSREIRDVNLDLKAVKEGWAAFSELEQAKIYSVDLKDMSAADRHLQKAGQAGETLALEKVGAQLKAAGQVSLRDQAFQALVNNDVGKAYDLFRRNLLVHPDDGWSHAAVGIISVLFGDMKTAEEDAQKSVTETQDAYTYSVLAYVLSLMARHAEAKAFYRKALKANPKYLPARFNLACLFLSGGQYRKAVTLYEALEGDGDVNNFLKARVLNNKGAALWALGEKNLAIQNFRKALEVRPGFEPAERNLQMLGGVPGPGGVKTFRE